MTEHVGSLHLQRNAHVAQMRQRLAEIARHLDAHPGIAQHDLRRALLVAERAEPVLELEPEGPAAMDEDEIGNAAMAPCPNGLPASFGASASLSGSAKNAVSLVNPDLSNRTSATRNDGPVRLVLRLTNSNVEPV